ncbi:MAG TPA: tyrosine-type recombinase/integrase [Acidobacteriaceae bacterium]|nr:tyrosine-type recombinase/integrase [Acidobacteriaceae bacterium]
MIEAVETYLALRRTAGFSLSNTEYLLRSFARFAGERKEPYVSTATAIEWACNSPSTAQRHTRYQTVYRFAEHIRLEEPRHELPPHNHFGYRKTRRVPHIYTVEEVERLVMAATQLPPAGSLRAHTYAALISLLAATGMRVSEALDLLLSDIHRDTLLIRKTKFQKTRLVPLHETAVKGLRQYLACRRRLHPGGEHVFVSEGGHRLLYWQVNAMFRKLLKSADLVPASGRAPRLHELRHTLAVRALEQCPAGRHRIGLHMVALATYMGHVNINSTYWYLQTTPELLCGIAADGEGLLYGGRP